MGMREHVHAHACVHDDVFFFFLFYRHGPKVLLLGGRYPSFSPLPAVIQEPLDAR